MAWKKASEGSGIVWCHDQGSSCHTSVKTKDGSNVTGKPFASVVQNSLFFDSALNSLSEKLNSLVNDTQTQAIDGQHKDVGLQVGFLRTGSGYLPVWKRLVLESEKLEDLVNISTLTDLDVMTLDQIDAYLQLKDSGATNGWWRHSTSGGVVHCHQGGMSCYVTVKEQVSGSRQTTTFFAEVPVGSPVYHTALAELTTKMNHLVSKTEAEAIKSLGEDSKLEMGFIATGSGLLPVWKRVIRGAEKLDDIVDSNTLLDLSALTDEQLDAHLGVSS